MDSLYRLRTCPLSTTINAFHPIKQDRGRSIIETLSGQQASSHVSSESVYVQMKSYRENDISVGPLVITV